MERRSRGQFLRGGLGLASLGMLAGYGLLANRGRQPERVPVVGYLSLGSPAESADLVAAFRQGLSELGYVEGQTVAIEYRYAGGGVDRLPGLAAELVRLPVDVLVARGTPPALAARGATGAIPIVAAPIGDPVGLGLAASDARPGGNITGLTNLGPELSAKRLEFLKQGVPTVSRVAALVNLTNPSAEPHLRYTLGAAQKLGLQVQTVEVRSPDDFEGAFDAATRGYADALVTHKDALFFQYGAQIAGCTLRGGLAGIFPEREFADAGGLLAYGANIPDIFRRAASYVDKILKGAKPAQLPVEGPTKLDFVINLQVARALGLTIPDALLQQAMEIIQ